LVLLLVEGTGLVTGLGALLAVVAFGEILEVQQLPPGHDQVADR
jgi:hypothetical protein